MLLLATSFYQNYLFPRCSSDEGCMRWRNVKTHLGFPGYACETTAPGWRQPNHIHSDRFIASAFRNIFGVGGIRTPTELVCSSERRCLTNTLPTELARTPCMYLCRYVPTRGSQQHIRGNVLPFLHPLIKSGKISTQNRATHMELIDFNKAYVTRHVLHAHVRCNYRQGNTS